MDLLTKKELVQMVKKNFKMFHPDQKGWNVQLLTLIRAAREKFQIE